MRSERSSMSLIENKLTLICLFILTIHFGEALTTIKDEDIPELQFMDTTVDPCENFYQYTCGNFKKHHPLGKERVVDEFTVLTEKIWKFMIYTLKTTNETQGSEALNKVKTAFESCLDLRITDSRKPYPEVKFLYEVGGMPLFQTPKTQPVFGWKEIGRLTAKYGVPLLFRITVIPFPISATDNLIRMEEDTFSNPSMAHPHHKQYLLKLLSSDLRSYLTELEGEDRPFGIFLQKVFTLLRDHINVDVTDEDIDKGIKEIVKFMRDIQNFAGVPDDANITPLTTTTVIGDLQQWTDQQFPDKSPIDWIEYLDKVFGEAGVKMTNTTNIYVNSTYVYNVLNVVRNTRPDVVKNFILMRILLFSAMDSHWQIRQALEDYYRVKNLTLYSREEYCVRQLIDIEPSDMVVGLSLASGRIYADNDNGKDRLTKAGTMIKDLSDTLSTILSNSAWMDASSETASLKKAKKIVDLVGLPEFVSNNTLLDELYVGLKIKKWDNYGNSQRLRAFKQAYMFSQMGRPRNRAHWDRSPFETNAYYNRANNKITIPFAMLNPVFFDGKLSLMDYSRLGALVGHELTHGFDNSGRQYDGNGTMNDIWTKETLDAYREKIKCFKQQYGRYFVEELNRTVDGSVSLNENLADNGGVRISYAASKKFFDSFRMDSKKFTAEQLFFIGFGTTFCSTETTEYLEYSLNKGYSPSKYRVIGALSNMEEFSRAFNCSKGSFMNPEAKCFLW
ncbi:neprilysin-1-like [Coccinella septempunctata]|uniref:neprilysin-1-like n=1 Tax=Coccinella septempunctata TaxID=41139 RepID=UPI001D083F64|nr:neprilysin-1-like [Coccinella septempunctata]